MIADSIDEKFEPFLFFLDIFSDFDDSGFYTLKKTAMDSHDPWLDNLSPDEIRKAKEAQEKRLAKEQVEEEATPVNRITLMKQVLDILEEGETTIRALKRLGGSKPQHHQKKKQEKKDVSFPLLPVPFFPFPFFLDFEFKNRKFTLIFFKPRIPKTVKMPKSSIC